MFPAQSTASHRPVVSASTVGLRRMLAAVKHTPWPPRCVNASLRSPAWRCMISKTCCGYKIYKISQCKLWMSWTVLPAANLVFERMRTGLVLRSMTSVSTFTPPQHRPPMILLARGGVVGVSVQFVALRSGLVGINHSTKRSVNQSIEQVTKQTINQTIKQSVNQSIGQRTTDEMVKLLIKLSISSNS